MRRRISWLVAATTSAVVLAFVVPLCLLVRSATAERAMASADQEARAVALLVSGLGPDERLGELVRSADQRSAAATSVLTPAGDVLGSAAAGLSDDPDVRRALEGEAFSDRDATGGRILVPVFVEDDAYVVRTAVSPDLLGRGVGRAWLIIATLGAVLLAAAVVIADRLGRRVSEPVTALATVAHRLKDGELDARADPVGPPEAVELADAFNQLADRINDLLVTERAHVGDLSHRLRTPVTALRLDVESVPDAALASRLQHHVAQLQRTVDAIVQDARRPLRHTLRSRCDAAAVVRERMPFWAALAEDQGRTLTVRLPARPVLVPLDGADLVDVLDVLVDNVFAHTADDVAFIVRLAEAGEQAHLEVADEGSGLAATGAGASRPGSTGLGLQIVRRTVSAVGGDLSTGSSPSGGASVRVTLPLLHDPPR